MSYDLFPPRFFRVVVFQPPFVGLAFQDPITGVSYRNGFLGSQLGKSFRGGFVIWKGAWSWDLGGPVFIDEHVHFM